MDAMDRLQAALGKLPGIGRRSAERIASRLVRDRDGVLRELVESLQQAAAHVVCCERCGSITDTEQQPCRLCTNPRRDGTMICVVEDPNDIAVIERSGGYHGRYHALMGKLSPMKGEGLRQLRAESLIERIQAEGVNEVILATSTDVEGDATASYIAELLKGKDVTVTRLAFGLPASSGIAYSDPVTLDRAIKGRFNY